MSITPSIPRLVTALAEWCACCACVARHPRRFQGPALWAILAAGLLAQSGFLQATGTLPLPWWIPCMSFAVLLMLALIWLCCEMKLTTAIYFTIRSFLLAEFAASLEWQLYSYAAKRIPVLAGRAGSAVSLVVTYALVYGFFSWLEGRREEPRKALEFSPRELLSPALIGLSSFLMSNLSFVYSDTPFSATQLFDIQNVRTLVDLAGMEILFSFHVQRCELYVQRERDAMQNLLQRQYDQYQRSQESIDLVNRKYHDLKHQIAVLRAEPDAGRRAAFLDGMEDEIRVFETQNKTGNPVLDTVLTGKSQTCAQNGIELTCIADGALLSGLEDMDICTIFGNLLENAMECEMKIPEREKRLIRLAVSRRRNFVFIQTENYCPEPVDLGDGVPRTTKDDPNYHGFGVPSVRGTAEKYGGSLTLRWADSWFTATVLLPLPE